MGKSLIIKGADFSNVAVPGYSIVWLNEFFHPTIMEYYFQKGAGTDNIIGPIYPQGARVSVIKLSLKDGEIVNPKFSNITIGDEILVYKATYNDTSFVGKTQIGNAIVTQSDKQNEYIILTFDEITLDANSFIGVTINSQIPQLIPITYVNDENTIPGIWINYSQMDANHCQVKGIACGYIV